MKKYSEKYVNEYKILKNAIIGFEFEFYSNMSYYKTLELLNIQLAPARTKGHKNLNYDVNTKEADFCLVPDASLGMNGCELVTSPMNYYDAKYYLIKIMKFIQTYGRTTDKSGLHINISFNDESGKNIQNLNILKHILTTNEDDIYRAFPMRKNNIYAKSIKKIIPFKQYDFSNTSIDSIKNTFRLPSEKYFGINFLHIATNSPRLEYRYIGGKDYEKKTGDIVELMDKFIIDTYNNINASFDQKDEDDLFQYLDKNINLYKNFQTYDTFLVEYPDIKIQVDQSSVYEVVSAYYNRIYNKLFTLLEGTDGLNECIINYFTQGQRIEVIDAKFKSVLNLNNFDFINCEINDGIFSNSSFIGCDVKNVQLTKCKVDESDVAASKVLMTNVTDSTITDCFFQGGVLKYSTMEGGVFRSGKVDESNISPSTKIVTGSENFFGINYGDAEMDKKGLIDKTGKGKGPFGLDKK